MSMVIADEHPIVDLFDGACPGEGRFEKSIQIGYSTQPISRYILIFYGLNQGGCWPFDSSLKECLDVYQTQLGKPKLVSPDYFP